MHDAVAGTVGIIHILVSRSAHAEDFLFLLKSDVATHW